MRNIVSLLLFIVLCNHCVVVVSSQATKTKGVVNYTWSELLSQHPAFEPCFTIWKQQADTWDTISDSLYHCMARATWRVENGSTNGRPFAYYPNICDYYYYTDKNLSRKAWREYDALERGLLGDCAWRRVLVDFMRLSVPGLAVWMPSDFLSNPYRKFEVLRRMSSTVIDISNQFYQDHHELYMVMRHDPAYQQAWRALNLTTAHYKEALESPESLEKFRSTHTVDDYIQWNMKFDLMGLVKEMATVSGIINATTGGQMSDNVFLNRFMTLAVKDVLDALTQIVKSVSCFKDCSYIESVLATK